MQADGTELEGIALEEAAAERRAAVHQLGNLTVVTPAFNSALSNSPWSVKRVEINKHSRLLLNARVAVNETWDEQAIAERGAWLAERLVEIWPGPDPAAWT